MVEGASRDDLHGVLLRGMPGSSRPPWGHLSQNERDALVDEVRRIRTEAARKQYVKSLIEEDGLTTDELAAAGTQKIFKSRSTKFRSQAIAYPTDVSQLSVNDEMESRFYIDLEKLTGPSSVAQPADGGRRLVCVGGLLRAMVWGRLCFIARWLSGYTKG